MIKNKKSGITLIALIITIIILLILAGVSISVVVGENGVITNSMDAEESHEHYSDLELRELTAAAAAGNFTMKYYKGVPIPAYFAVSEVPSEQSVEDGLVIIDMEGNEFVWIPVESDEDKMNWINAKDYAETKKYNVFGLEDDKNIKWQNKDSSGKCFTGDDQTYTEEDVKNAESILEEDSSEEDSLEEDSLEEDSLEENSLKENIALRSIIKYGGFYVARFEAGVPSDASFYVPSNKSGDGAKYLEDKDSDEYIPVSKRWNQAWNCISQQKAKIVSEKMYEQHKEVNSYLIDSHAWNYICEHIFKEKEGIDIMNSKDYGNYQDNKTTKYNTINWSLFWKDGGNEYVYGKGSRKRLGSDKLVLGTGASDDFKIYQIYDMAGNLTEYTSEYNIGFFHGDSAEPGQLTLRHGGRR